MKLFTVGPVDMYPETLKKGGEPIPYFRTDEFSDMMFQIEKDFLALAHAGEDSKLITLTASGTGAMEATVMNVLSKEDKVLVIDGGGFGHRFFQMCELHCIPATALKLAFGEVLTEDRLRPFEGQGYTALLVNIDETSTGQLYDYQMLGDFCKRNHMLYIVDAISSFLADELDMEKGHVDVLITASQKALALPPGLSFVILGKTVIERRVMKLSGSCMYFDFKDYLKNMERGQTPFTPAVGICYQLSERLSFLRKQGVEVSIEHHRKLAEYFRKLCAKAGITVVSYPKSNAVTALYFPQGNAKEVFRIMKERYGKMLTPSGGELADTLLRVGHLGDLGKEDYEELVSELSIVTK